MQKKTDTLKKIISAAVSTSVLSSVKNAAKDILKKAQDIVYYTQEKMMEMLAAGIIMLTGVIMMLIGLVYLINNSFNLQEQWGFLIVGFIILLTGKIFFNKTEQKKYYPR